MAKDEKKKSVDALGKLAKALVGAADRPLRIGADKLAESVPRSSWLRSSTAEFVFGIIRQFLEELGSDLPTTARIAVEKTTDFGDFLASALYRKDPKEIAKALEDWKQKFFNEAVERMAKATDPQAEFDRLKKEFNLREEIQKLIEDSAPTPQLSQPPVGKSWKESWKEFETRFNQIDTATARVLRNVRSRLAERGIK